MNLQQANQLKAADQAAKQHSAHQAADESGPECPLQQKHVIEVLVVGEDDKPLSGIGVELRNTDDKVLRAKTDQSGVVRYTGLEPSNYQVSLWELDKEAWQVASTEPLAQATTKSQAQAAWTSPPANNTTTISHTIEQGECIAKISDHYGFFPQTVWDFAANAMLKELRKDMYILAPGDNVVIPTKRVNALNVSAGKRIVLKRKGVPEKLRIRFLDYDDSPRKGISYLLSVKTADGDVLPDLKAETDDKGFVDQFIPPDAVFAKIVLSEGQRQEIHEFDLGYVNPMDSVSGVKARLNNLGYACGAEDGELGEKTIAAIKAFQRNRKLTESGEVDKPTKQALLDLALS
jgi:hypothetical protein